MTNFLDRDGKAGDVYKILAIDDGTIKDRYTIKALDTNYMAIPLQRPEPGRNRIGEEFTYSANDSAVGDLDGDGQFEIILKWEPSNVIDPSQEGLTGPTIFDAIRLDGTLLWRMNMGFNLTSGPHYHQFLVYDFDCDGKAELFIKTADGTRVYGVTDGRVDYNKIVSQIGNREHDGMFIGDHGKVTHGPEYISIFNGLTGEVIDTVNYEFPVDSNPGAWGDTWFNRSDRFLAAVAYLDGTTPSAVFGRGIYERTTFVAYDLVDGELITRWVFDSDVAGIQYEGLGNHSLHVGDVDNDGRDEILAGSLTIDDDGSVLYAMDGLMNRDRGAHGDAMHVGAFDPDREGLQVFGIHEGVGHASMQYRCASTGETIIAIHAHRDVGRGVAANITSSPGVEFWGTGDFADVTRGSGIYNVRGQIEHDNWRAAGLSVNFAIYWDGDLLRELLDDINIIKFNENTGVAEPLISFYGTVSNNGTKATPTLQADILGDWREEVLLRTPDSSELRLFSTTIPTDYRIYTLMHDHLYRMSVAWQNVAYNQPPHLGFYLGEDIRQQVLAGDIRVPLISLIVPELPVLPPVVPEAIVNDDFQNYEPGILMRLTDLSPKLWQGYELVINPGGTGNAQFEINRDPLTGNQSILLRDDYATPAGWLELRRTFPEITSGIVTVDIGFMQPVTATVARPLRIVDSAGNEVARLDTRAGPAISVRNHDGTVFTEMGRYSANEWVRIRLIIDLNNRIFNAFFNGRRVGEFPFNSAAATGIARIESRTPGSAVRSHFIDNVFVAPYKKIEAPVNFNAVAGDRQVNFTWDAVWGASTYTLKKGLESGGPYQIVATGVRDTSYLLTGLTNDVAYYFVVKAVTEDKMESALSLEVRAVPSTVPATPENITYTLDFATVSLSWDAVPTADSYVIRYGIQKELLEHSLEVHTNKHVFDDLEPGQIYFFTVSAKNEIGEGSPSQPLAIRAGDAKIYQAEYSVFPGSGIESIADRNFTGSGYVNMSSIVGSYIEWTVGMDAAGLQTLRLYYSLGRTDQTRPMSVSVNGMVIRDRVEFEPTFAGVFPSWGVWNTVEIKDVMLNEGPNKIRFTVLEFDGPNIDKLTVTGQPGLEYRVLSVESLGLGRVEVSPAGAVFPCTYVKGTIVTLNAATGNLFKFSHWSGDLTGSQSPADVTLDRNLAIQAHFLPDLEHVERAPGFAGLGIGTFGGFGGEVVTVTNKEELRNAIRDNVSRIIQVSGSIDLGQGAWIPVGSFKTILGLGDDAELLGGGLLLTGSTQVIIRNLRLGNAITPGYDPVAGVDAEFDALQINNSTHVWVDQCTFKNDAEIWVNNETSFDGLLDLINGSSYITISNSIFENHNQTMLIGNSDTLLSDRGRFRITLFNNWFRGTTTRHPRVRFGQVHVFNNYFDAVGYGIGVGVEASIISESNYFKNTAEPWRYLDSAAQPGFIRSEGDLFRESALIPEREEGVTWNPAEKYGHVLKAPESARAHTRVRAGAGRAGKVIRIDNESVTTGIRTHEITGTAAEKTILRVYNNAVLVLTREIDAYYDFRIPVYLNPGKNSFEIKADGDVVRFTVILEIPPVDIPEQPPVQPLAPVVPVTPVSVAEQPVIEGQRTVVELEGIIEIVAEAGAIEGDEAKLRAEIIPKDEASRILENAVAAEIVSVGQIVVLTLTGGEFTGRVNLTFGFDAARIPTGQMPSVFVYNERTGRWIYLGGRVVNGKISVSVSTFSKFGVFAANPLPPLTDIDNHWAQRSIMTMAGMDIVEGYPDGKFKPNAVITRAEFAAMLIRALGVEGKPEGALRFKDAADFDWAKGAIGALAELGIVFGIEDRRFAGGNKMTRAEAAVMLERVIAKGLIRIEYRESKAFADEKLFPQWAKSGIRAAKGFGLIRGFADGTFGYERSITRAEVATILYRLVAES